MAKSKHAFWRGLWAAEYGIAAIGGGLALLMIMIITVLSVAGRYLLHMDLIPGAYNMIERVLFPLMVFWALPLAHREGLFPRLELFMAARMTPLQRTLIAIFVGLVELAVYMVLIYFIWLFVDKAVATNRTVMINIDKWPMWPIAIMMPLAFGLMMIEMVRLIGRDARAVLTGKPSEPEENLGPTTDTL